MRAAVWTKYGPPEVLQIREVAKPVPRENEVLIRVHAATVTAGDCQFRRLRDPLLLALPFRLYVGLMAPRRITILGQELAGEVEAVGGSVSRFRVGEPVFGTTGLRLGAYAEYICLPAERRAGALAIKPANITLEEAACVPMGGLEALHFMRRAGIQNGEEVLINGAGGSIGTYAVQLGRYFGAEVTAVDGASKLDMLRSIGATHVVDYTQEDFTGNGRRYDVIFDVVGKIPFSRAMRSLKPRGRYMIGNPGFSHRLRARLTSPASDKRVIIGTSSQTIEALIALKGLIEAGSLRPVIDRRYRLDQIAEAHRYVETGQKAGNVVIRIVD